MKLSTALRKTGAASVEFVWHVLQVGVWEQTSASGFKLCASGICLCNHCFLRHAISFRDRLRFLCTQVEIPWGHTCEIYWLNWMVNACIPSWSVTLWHLHLLCRMKCLPQKRLHVNLLAAKGHSPGATGRLRSRAYPHKQSRCVAESLPLGEPLADNDAWMVRD